LPAAHAIERAAFSDPWTLAHLAECLRQGIPFLVATDGARIVGYVIARTAADEAEILTLGVADGARRRGIGRALVRAARARVAALGARAVYLEVRESNLAARHLYAAEGFVAVGRRAGYYRRPTEDAIVLRAVIMAARGDA